MTTTIQIVLDKNLLKAADIAAKQQHVNRSALIREALQRHLKHLHELQLEEQDRKGYRTKPQREKEYRIWEEAAAPLDEVCAALQFALGC
ncbi:MAG TPA: ribbon-helix-helix domain-containing protein [Bryobacteraceae bacterium]|nr:ribbon-helix-helix domain-containing protein [Bryobacteraceae bacterium]